MRSGPGRFPVLAFSPAGFPPLALAAIVEEIASHGYVVAGVTHTYESAVTAFPDGRVVPMNAAWMQPTLGPFSGVPEDTFRARAAIAYDKTADLSFVVDQLEMLDAGTDRLGGRLDMARLGAFGHSLGGNAALEWCRIDDRCKAAANLDGANWSAVGSVGLTRPALQILADHTDVHIPCEEQVHTGIYPTVEWCEAERSLMVEGWQMAYERASPGYGVTIRGSGHISFMDAVFLLPEAGSRAADPLASVRIDSRRAWRITCDYLLAFFAKHLSGADNGLLAGPSAEYPEVEFGAPERLLRTAPPNGEAGESESS